VLGLLGAGVICGVTFFNDMVMRGTFLVGNYMPVSVFGALLLFVLLVNPLLSLVSDKARLTGPDLAVIVALTLCACFIPGRGLMHQFTTFLMLPHHHARTDPSWQGDPVKLDPESVQDWPAVVRGLREGRDQPETGLRGQLWRRLPSELQARMLAAVTDDALSADLCSALLEALNGLLPDRDLVQAADPDDARLPKPIRTLLADDSTELSPEEVQKVNRALLEAAFPAALKPRQPVVVEHAPPAMLADPRRNSTVALDGFVNGLAVGDEAIEFGEVPWHAWRRTLLFWVPLIFAMSVAVIGLSLVLHRQWADHENLPYPTVEFARSLLPEEGRLLASVFRNRFFWIAAGLVFAVHMNNYACMWWPDTLVRIRTRFSFWPLLELFPVFKRSHVGVWQLFNPTVYFTVIGFAYFLAADASLSLGIAPYVYALATGIVASYGIAMGGRFLQPSIDTFLYAGAYFSMFLVLAYTGRQHYANVFRGSIGLRSRDPAEPHAVWGGRAFLLGAAAFAVQLMVVGLDWPLALFYTFGTVVIFVVISRLLAEAGVFYVHAYFFPCVVLWGFLGARTVGPDELLIMGMVSSVLLIDPREALMPFVVSGVHLVDRTRGKVGGLATWGVLALAIGFAAAIPATLYWQYRQGAIRAGDGWTCQSVPKFAFDATSQVRRTLEAQGAAGAAATESGWKRLAAASPKAPCVIGFALTFSLVLLFTFLRHRFPWWPFHPLLFLVLGTWQSKCLAFSFLLGWAVKAGVTKYGGAAAYQKLKPLMIGLIAGEMLAGVVPMIIGAVYYFVTGKPPEAFAIFR